MIFIQNVYNTKYRNKRNHILSERTVKMSSSKILSAAFILAMAAASASVTSGSLSDSHSIPPQSQTIIRSASADAVSSGSRRDDDDDDIMYAENETDDE